MVEASSATAPPPSPLLSGDGERSWCARLALCSELVAVSTSWALWPSSAAVRNSCRLGQQIGGLSLDARVDACLPRNHRLTRSALPFCLRSCHLQVRRLETGAGRQGQGDGIAFPSCCRYWSASALRVIAGAGCERTLMLAVGSAPQRRYLWR